MDKGRSVCVRERERGKRWGGGDEDDTRLLPLPLQEPEEREGGKGGRDGTVGRHAVQQAGWLFVGW